MWFLGYTKSTVRPTIWGADEKSTQEGCGCIGIEDGFFFFYRYRRHDMSKGPSPKAEPLYFPTSSSYTPTSGPELLKRHEQISVLKRKKLGNFELNYRLISETMHVMIQIIILHRSIRKFLFSEEINASLLLSWNITVMYSTNGSEHTKEKETQANKLATWSLIQLKFVSYI